MMCLSRYAPYPVLLFFVALLVPGESHTVVVDTAPTVASDHCTEAHTTGTNSDAIHSFRWQGQLFEVSAKGQLSAGRGGRDLRQQLEFSSDRDDWIEKLYVAEHQHDLILIGEVDHGEAGNGFVMRLAHPGSKRKWLALIPGFNVGNALLRGRYVYVSAIGFVGKLDLITGRYAWRHADLYPKNQAFNNFATPFVEGSAIVFLGEGPYGHKDNEILVDDRSGRILKFRTSPVR